MNTEYHGGCVRAPYFVLAAVCCSYRAWKARERHEDSEVVELMQERVIEGCHFAIVHRTFFQDQQITCSEVLHEQGISMKNLVHVTCYSRVVAYPRILQ